MTYQYAKRLPVLLAVLAALLLSGCATKQEPLYYWGDFQSQQYSYLKGDKGPEEGIINLEKVREEAKSRGKSVPPGLQAHLGMLYGVTGRTDLFEKNLLAEKSLYPESAAYVDFLLKKKQQQKVVTK